jgi:glycolate oxidase FAD binding subunit
VRCRRDPTSDDAVSGVAPRHVFEPRSHDECAEVFALARSERLALAVVGGGTELGLGPPPSRLDAVVSSRGLDRVLEYAPSDQVIVVEAGITLSSLQAVLAPHGQRLACDPPHPDTATMGGLLAANAFGPLRSRHGSLRDLLIGVSILRADGTTVRGGGKVVKNVAGFDLPKLAVGSLGSLGMIATAAFRLHPAPEAVATLRFRRMTPRDVRLLTTAVRAAQVEPAAFVAIGAGDTFDVLLRFEGFAAGVAEQRNRAATLAAPSGPPAEALSPAEGRAAWREHDAARAHGNACVKVSTLPTSLESLASEVVPRLKAVMADAATVLHPTLGLSFVAGDARDAVDFAAALASARARVGRGPGSLVVHRAPAAMLGAIDVWGPLPGAFSTMKRVKEGFDPDGRMNPGRFVGGL